MELREFIATRRYVEDLSTAGIGLDDKAPGFVYADTYYIVDTKAWTNPVAGSWDLVLGSQEFCTDDLHDLEKILYDYAAGENSWNSQLVEFKFTMKVPKDIDEKRLDVMLQYVEDVIEEGERPGGEIWGVVDKNWVYSK